MTRAVFSLKAALCLLALSGLTACGGAGGSTVVEVEDPNYIQLDNRGATGQITVAYLLLDGETPVSGDALLAYATGAVTTGLLDGTDVDNTGIYPTSANTEYARIVRISGADSLFGVAGLQTAGADIPTAGTTTSYSSGWVSLFANSDSETYSLTGNAALTASWGTGALLDATFNGFTGTNSSDASVTNAGTLRLNDMTISGSGFSGGTASGTGIFAVLDGSSATVGTQGLFFGPAADEVGGVIIIRDPDLDVTGAFLAD